MSRPVSLVYQFLIIGLGWGWLLASWTGAPLPWGTFLSFALVSLLVRRAGFPIAEYLTHSLANVVNVAALLLMGPVGGALLASLTSVIHFVLSALLRRRLHPRSLFRLPLFDGAVKAIMALVSGSLYLRLGGTVAPTVLTPELLLPLIALFVSWFVTDYLLWTFLFWSEGGRYRAGRFLVSVSRVSALIELAPLPFALLLVGGWLRFDPPLQALLLAASVLVAVIVQGFASTLRQLRRRIAVVSLLNRFGLALAEAQLDEARIGTLFNEYAGDLLPGARVELLLRHRDGSFRAPAAPTIGLDAWLPTLLPLLRERPRGRLLTTLSAEALAEEASRLPADRPERGSVLIMPLMSGDEMLGLSAAQSAEPDALTLDDGRSLSVLATQAAVTMQNAQHFRREQIRMRQLRSLAAVSHLVASALSLDEFLWQVVEIVRENFDLYHVQIFLVDPQTNEVVFRAGSGEAGRALARQPLRLQIGREGIVGWVAATSEPLVVADVRHEARYVHDPIVHLVDTVSEVALPLRVESRTLGVLDVQSDRPLNLDREALQTLTTLADQIAIGIEDARLYVAQREAAAVTSALLQVAEVLNPLFDQQAMADTLVGLVPSLAETEAAAVYLWDEGRQRFRCWAARGFPPSTSDEENCSILPDDLPLLARAREQSSGLILAPADPTLAAFGNLALVALPLAAQGLFLGVLLLGLRPATLPLNKSRQALFIGIASQAAAAFRGGALRAAQEAEALENERRTQEFIVARQVQSALLPERAPELEGYDIAAYWRPAREVAGDFYDFVRLSQGRVALAVVDVADKGLGAALFMVLTRAVLRESLWSEEHAGRALERTNVLLAADARGGMFLTIFLALLQPATGEMEVANAGHLPPLLYHAATEALSVISPRQLPLAIFEETAYPSHQVQIDPGDLLVLYTDGVTDIFSPEGEPFGMTRLAEVVYANRHRTARGLVNAILEGAVAHGARGPFHDDLTLLVLRRLKQGAATKTKGASEETPSGRSR